MRSSELSRIAGIARRWEEACRSTDNTRIIDQLSQDAVVWYNFNKTVLHDRAAYRVILDEGAKGFRKQRYKDFRVHLHENGFVEQATLVGETDRGEVETPFLLVATVKGDKISRIEEYFDTTGWPKDGWHS
jgi:ketosteroid isomerase-like protein